jgi:hypothetical protein
MIRTRKFDNGEVFYEKESYQAKAFEPEGLIGYISTYEFFTTIYPKLNADQIRWWHMDRWVGTDP